MNDLTWRKSSYSGTNSDCVELARLPRGWRESSYSSTNSDCVELADVDDIILVRNSNHPDAGTLTLTHAEMEALVKGVKSGDLDWHL